MNIAPNGYRRDPILGKVSYCWGKRPKMRQLSSRERTKQICFLLHHLPQPVNRLRGIIKGKTLNDNQQNWMKHTKNQFNPRVPHKANPGQSSGHLGPTCASSNVSKRPPFPTCPFQGGKAQVAPPRSASA